MLYVIVLSGIMLNVVKLNVVHTVLSVMMPIEEIINKLEKKH
jgi:hypothetical protein